MSGRLILGCDPGATGAYAFLTEAGDFVRADEMPIAQKGTTKWIDGIAMLNVIKDELGGRECTAVVEHVHAMPKISKGGQTFGQGAVGAFSQGGTLCSLLAILQIAGARIELISAAGWKKALRIEFTKQMEGPQRKEICRQEARRLFPAACHRLERKSDHNRAEAILLAHWYLTYGPRAAVSRLNRELIFE